MVGYTIVKLDYVGGKKPCIPNAAITIRKPDGSEVTEAAISESGSVDAVAKAIQRALGISMNLKDFHVSAMGADFAAEGEVAVRIEHGGVTHEGTGIDTDIVVASAEAFIDALNKQAAFNVVVAAHTV